MADTTLKTRRLILRPPHAGDLSWILTHINTATVMRHLGEVRSPERVAEALEADVAAFADGVYRRWTVWLRDGGRRVGRCGLFHVRTDAAPEELRGQYEIGWTQATEACGQGYATEAARAVLDFGFRTLGSQVIYSQTSDLNVPSTRMMTRLGLERIERLDYDDPDYPPAENPTRVYRLTREIWEAADV